MISLPRYELLLKLRNKNSSPHNRLAIKLHRVRLISPGRNIWAGKLEKWKQKLGENRLESRHIQVPEAGAAHLFPNLSICPDLPTETRARISWGQHNHQTS